VTSVALGIDVGGSAVKWAVTRAGQLVDTGSEPTPHGSAEAVLDLLAQTATTHSASAVGVALPGPVSPEGDDALFVPNLPGEWTRTRLLDRVRAGQQRRVVLLNDGHASTLAELRLGAGRGQQDMALFTLGTGVGGGIALGGRLYRGALGRGGELGHLPSHQDSVRCACGNRGCLETACSAPAIVAAAARAVITRNSPGLRQACGGDIGALTSRMVGEAAASGDRFAQDVMDRAGAALGVAIAAVSAVLAPQLVVIGGGVAGAFDTMRPAMDGVLEGRRLLLEPSPVTTATLGPLAGAIGAALFTHEESDDE
jgi:glucokinase